MKIAVVNESKLVSSADVATMTLAVNQQVNLHVCPAWGFSPVSTVFYPSRQAVPADAWLVAVLDDPDEADALGYHTEDNGVVSGKVFTKPCLDNGAKALTGQYAVSSVLSHEVLEVLVDPWTTDWTLSAVDRRGNATFVSKEICDPVENLSYNVTVNNQSVTVSNFVRPEWFDVQTRARSTDYLGKVTKPFHMATGGYVVIWDNKGQRQVFGEKMPQWRQNLKKQADSRGFRRTLTSTNNSRFYGVA